MTTKAEQGLDMEALEGMVDRHGVRGVLDMLSDIASEKANHVATNWQDKNMEREWNKAAKSLDTLARKLVTPLD